MPCICIPSLLFPISPPGRTTAGTSLLWEPWQRETDTGRQRCQGRGARDMCQTILPIHVNHFGELSVERLLNWTDTNACLAGKNPGNDAMAPTEP
uniref:Uncharacterized protein n=1 Tax=Salvator merianae TaxID=96440 RepID=A0A8D0BHY3_SALMN